MLLYVKKIHSCSRDGENSVTSKKVSTVLPKVNL